MTKAFVLNGAHVLVLVLSVVVVVVVVVVVGLWASRRQEKSARGYFLAQVIIALGMVAVALSTPPPPSEQWQPLQWAPHQLRHLDEGVRRPWFQSLKLWFAVFAAAWIAVYCRFW